MSFCDEHGTSDSCPECMCENCTSISIKDHEKAMAEQDKKLTANFDNSIADIQNMYNDELGVMLKTQREACADVYKKQEEYWNGKAQQDCYEAILSASVTGDDKK